MTVRIDHVKQLIAEHRIDTVECGLGDLHGQLRGKRLPAEQFLAIAGHGFNMGDGIFAMDHQSAVAPTSFTNPAGGYPDMLVRPLLDTFRPVPWRPGSAAVLCEALTQREQTPLPVCPRQALRRLLDEAADAGYQFLTATELEFYLLNGDRTPWPPAGRCYSLTSGAAVEPVLRDIRQGLADFGIPVEASHVEFGAGQVEVNVRAAPALACADQTLYFKAAVREIAARHGMLASFMAKPWSDQPGSGMHLHLSLASERGNLFATPSPPPLSPEAGARGASNPPLSPLGGRGVGGEGGDSPLGNRLMEHCLAGLLAHLPGLIFLSSTTVNGYKRLVEHSFAPTTATWGVDNRTAAVRVLGHGPERRLEYRGGAADANPYLLLAGCAAAALDGLRRRLMPPGRTDGDAYVRGTALPRTLPEGIAAFEADTVLQEALGPVLARHLVEMARREWELFRTAVTDWERQRYLESA